MQNSSTAVGRGNSVDDCDEVGEEMSVELRNGIGGGDASEGGKEEEGKGGPAGT